jgi:hypothetical protein
MYLTGMAGSDYLTKNALQGTLGGSNDIFLAKLDLTLTSNSSLKRIGREQHSIATRNSSGHSQRGSPFRWMIRVATSFLGFLFN